MANDCMFTLEANGRKEDLEAMIKAGNYESDVCFYRMFQFDPMSDIEGEGDDYRVMICGDCAWSVHGCMFDTYEPLPCTVKGNPAMQVNFLDFCKDHNISFCIWSEEPGCAFIEHFEYQDGSFLEESTDAIWWNDESYDKLVEAGYETDEYDECNVINNARDARNILAMNKYETIYSCLVGDQKDYVDHAIERINWEMIDNYLCC